MISVNQNGAVLASVEVSQTAVSPFVYLKAKEVGNLNHGVRIRYGGKR